MVLQSQSSQEFGAGALVCFIVSMRLFRSIVFSCLLLSAGGAVLSGGGLDIRDESGSAVGHDIDRARTVPGGVVRFVDKLVPSERFDGDQFGYSVAIDDRTIAVGAPEILVPFVTKSAVYIFEPTPSGSDDWEEVAQFKAAETSHCLGYSVSIDGDTAVGGNHHEDPLGGNSGAAHVYEADENGIWSEVSRLIASDGQSDDLFGRGVAIQRDTILAGATPFFANGSVYTFRRSKHPPTAGGRSTRSLRSVTPGTSDIHWRSMEGRSPQARAGRKAPCMSTSTTRENGTRWPGLQRPMEARNSGSGVRSR